MNPWEDKDMSSKSLSHARRLAIRHHKGETLTPEQYAIIRFWVDKVSPENFYMDGELFAS